MSDLIINKNLKVITIATESLRLITDYSKLLEDECPLDRQAAVLLIGETIRQVLTEVLMDRPLKYQSLKDTHTHVRNAYADTKKDLETCIGLAFTYAIKKFTKEEMQYICEINPIQLKNPKTDN